MESPASFPSLEVPSQFGKYFTIPPLPSNRSEDVPIKIKGTSEMNMATLQNIQKYSLLSQIYGNDKK